MEVYYPFMHDLWSIFFVRGRIWNFSYNFKFSLSVTQHGQGQTRTNIFYFLFNFNLWWEKWLIMLRCVTYYTVICPTWELERGVARCLSVTTNNMVAVKVPNDMGGELPQWEIHFKNPGPCTQTKQTLLNTQSFKFQNALCLVLCLVLFILNFLLDFLSERRLVLNEIRPVTHQLMVVLEALKSLGIMHRDLKPDNIVLINDTDQPFKIKLMHFGLALPGRMAQPGMLMQVFPCLMWLICGEWPICTLAFPPPTTVNTTGCKRCYTLGHPEDCQLNSAKDAWKYFTREHDSWQYGTIIQDTTRIQRSHWY